MQLVCNVGVGELPGPGVHVQRAEGTWGSGGTLVHMVLSMCVE